MKTNTKSIMNLAGAGALAVAMTTSAFAAPQRGIERGPQSNGRTESRNDNNGSYRDNQRMNNTGKITSFSHEKGGYRVQLDRGRESYWIPEARMNNRGRDLRVGLTLVLGGVFRGGRIEVDAVTWPDSRNGYRQDRDDNLRGTVERVDLRSGTLVLRTNGAGSRTIQVDMRDTRHSRRTDLRDLHRGDFVTLSGQWLRNGRFEAESIESVKTRR
jgi:hypothetical protein